MKRTDLNVWIQFSYFFDYVPVFSKKKTSNLPRSTNIVRGLCDVCINIKSVTFVTDEQNALSLCPAEGPENLVAVRIPRLSVRRWKPHMYPRRSVPSDVCLDMYVKDEVLCRARQWDPWSTSVK